jgi:hypothetical protein
MATIKKAQKGKKVTPTYKNLKMGVKNENYSMTGVNRDITPSSKDSARYRGGFEQGLKGMKGLPNEGTVEKMGRWEGQNFSKKAPKKSQMGATMPKPSENPKKPKSVSMKPTKIIGMKIGGKVKKAQMGDKRPTREEPEYSKFVGPMQPGKSRPNMKIGGKIKKAQTGVTESGPLSKVPEAGAMRKTKMKERSADGNYMKKTVTRETPAGSKTSTKVRRTAQGILRGASSVQKYKMGGKMSSKMSKMSKKK